MKKVLGCIRKACEDFDLIEEGDRIGVGVSGGKDSLLLLYALALYRKFSKAHFSLVGLTLTMGLSPMDTSGIRALCDHLEVEYIVRETQIGKVIFEERREKNPCSLCAKMRKGALHTAAVEAGCNKVALGHNKDDVVETFFMSLFYEGRMNCFSPVSFLDRTGLTSIRPLIYVPEWECRSYVRENSIQIVKNPCLADGNTKRQETKELLADLSKQYDHLQEKVFGAIFRSDLKGWKKPVSHTEKT